MRKQIVLLFLPVFLSLFVIAAPMKAAEYLTGIKWAEPKVIDPGTACAAPSDATVLFDGTDMSQWENAENWKVTDGFVTAGPGAIRSVPTFGDCQVHLEFSSAEPPTGSSQGRSNSGLFLNGIYEVQILDSYENVTYFDGQCGAIYKQHPPLVNASRKPGEWQTYDVIWKAPRFAIDGNVQSPAFVTVLHNGVVIQNYFELLGDTPYNRPPEYRAHPFKGPISLQYHGNPVRFRNIWVRDLVELKSERVHEPKIVGQKPAQHAKKKPSQEKPNKMIPAAAKPTPKPESSPAKQTTMRLQKKVDAEPEH